MEPAELKELSYGVNDGFEIIATDGHGNTIPGADDDIIGPMGNGLALDEDSTVAIESKLSPPDYKLVYFELETQYADNITLTLVLASGEMETYQVIFIYTTETRELTH